MNIFIRQFHRWVSVIFVLTVIVYSVALAVAVPPEWMAYTPLLPLFLLLLSGIWLFVLPYLRRRRG